MNRERGQFNPSENLEINQESQEAIKKIEQLKIGMEQAAGLILVKLGVKPAADLDIFKWNNSPEEIEQALKETGLVYQAKELPAERNQNLIARYSVGRDQATVEVLLKLEPSEHHEEYGRMMGYPETAIAVFGKPEENIGVKDLPDMEGLDKESLAFRFKLSKDHWRDEIKVLEHWSQALKQAAPDLYERLRDAQNRADYIEKEKNDPDKNQLETVGHYREILGNLHNKIKSIEQPLGHGTTSEYLESILSQGLGEEFPENSSSETISLTNLTQPDGLLGAYAFARMNTQDLGIKSEELSGKDLISRYIEVNPLINEKELRNKFDAYKRVRKPTGFPILFIYDGGNLVLESVNPKVPSEVELPEPFNDKPKVILVPEKYITEVKALLDEQNVKCDIFPIETLELD